LKPTDTIIEIGPGHGELTKKIKNQKSKIKIIAIEKDINLAEILKQKFSGDKNLEIIEGDALTEIKYQISKIKNTNKKSKIIKNLKIVGNIPYYITGYLLRILSELECKPSLIVFTLQKEVAERVSAAPPKMNLLAASVQFWAEPKIIGYISKKDFRPQPKVDSAIIKLETRDERQETRNEEKYYKLIRALFKQPRKTILNNLRDAKIANPSECREKLIRLGINPTGRPQNLSIEQIIELSQIF